MLAYLEDNPQKTQSVQDLLEAAQISIAGYNLGTTFTTSSLLVKILTMLPTWTLKTGPLLTFLH